MLLAEELHDFRVMLWQIWKSIGQREPTPLQYDMANYLQFGGDDLLLEAFRGVGKSVITGGYVDWLHAMSFVWEHGCSCKYCVREPWNGQGIKGGSLNVMVVSAGRDKADEFSQFAQRLLEDVEAFNFMVPRNPRRWSMQSFDIEGAAALSQSASVTSRGIFGQMTGGRAHALIFDDIEVPKTSETVHQREKLKGRAEEFAAILIPGGKTRGLGTPQNQDSIYNLMADEGYRVRIWPILYPTAEEREAYGDRLAPSIRKAAEEDPSLEGTSTEPLRFSDDDIERRRMKYAESGFRLQFMLDTSLSDANRYPLRARDLVVMDLDPRVGPEGVIWCNDPDKVDQELENYGFRGDRYYRPMGLLGVMKPYEGGVMQIDPSGRGADECTAAVVKMISGNLFLTALGAWAGGYEDSTLEAIARLAKEQDVDTIRIESNFGDGMFQKLLSPHLVRWGVKANIEENRATVRKELRICDTLEPVMNQHRLIVNRRVLEADHTDRMDVNESKRVHYKFGHQLTHQTREKDSLTHDDKLDAVAGAVEYWADILDLDQEQAMIRNQLEDWSQGMDEFFEEVEARQQRPSLAAPNALNRYVKQRRK